MSISPGSSVSRILEIVYSKFILSDGSLFNGYVYGEPSDDIGFIQPNIIIANKQIPFWSGIRKPNKLDINDYYSTLNKTKKDIFPIKWKVNIPMEEIIQTGLITGFGYYKSIKNKKIKFVN